MDVVVLLFIFICAVACYSVLQMRKSAEKDSSNSGQRLANNYLEIIVGLLVDPSAK